MTEYWVSQGNKWCDFCKIYIANNPLSIRTHEQGQRHKDSVAQRLTNMRKEKVAKDKEEKEAAKALEQIEAKAKRSYQNDVAAVQQTRDSNSHAASTDEWDYDSTSGYYVNRDNGYYYDPNSGFYYSDAIGKWISQEEAFATLQSSSGNKHGPMKKPVSASDTGIAKYQSGLPPGVVVPRAVKVNPTKSVKGAPSSISVSKRKRVDEKRKVVSKEEAAALKAREAAKRKVEERETIAWPLQSLIKVYHLYTKNTPVSSSAWSLQLQRANHAWS